MINQVFLDPSGPWIITGSIEFDSDNGAHLKLPQGTTFPTELPETGDFFFRSDELKLYRYSGSAWQEQVAAIAAHHVNHEPGGSDAMAVDAAAVTGSLRTIGTGSLQACAGNDSRLSDARTPTSHATSHEPGGSDAMAVDAAAVTGSLRTIGTGSLQACAGNDSRLSDARTPISHATSHEPGGSDAMAVDAAAVTGSLRTIGTGALQACAGNDSRLSDARTPISHATSHASGGSDSIKLDDLAVPDDNTDLNATTGQHGLLPKLGGGTTDYLRADGSWATPPGGGGGGNLVKMLQLIDVVGGMKITTSPKPLEFTYEYIKDDYYSHSTTVDPEIVEILQDGWYRITAEMTVHTVSASAGSRGNPQLHIDIDTGSGWVQQPDAMGGYIREDGSENLACSITGVGLFQFSAGDKIRITIYDSATTPPDEETVQYSSRLILEYIDRTGSASGTVENLKDIGDVDADAPNDGDMLSFNSTTSKWENVGGGTDVNAVHVNGAGEIAGIGIKTTPMREDLLIIEDSEASNVKKRVTVGDLLAAEPDYFNGEAPFFDEFFPGGLNPQWATSTSGTGSLIDLQLAPAGQCLVRAGNASGRFAELYFGGSTAWQGLLYEPNVRWRLKYGGISDVRIELEIHYQDSSNYCLIRGDWGGNWFLRTSYLGTETAVDTGVALDTAWHNFEIRTKTNRVDCYIDDVLVATSTTNIPAGSGTVSVWVYATGTGGTKDLLLDAFYYDSMRPS